jgi:hypothetical protein
MITWSESTVAKFLKASCFRPAEEPAAFGFQFTVGAAQAELRVFPADGDVSLVLTSPDSEGALASWKHDCSRIEIHEEEESGPCIILASPEAGGQLRCWIAIVREKTGFSISTSAVVPLPAK